MSFRTGNIPPTLSSKIWSNAPDALNGLGRSAEVPVFRRRNPPLPVVLQEAVNLILGAELGELLVDVVDDETGDILRLHVWHSADGELSSDLGWDDGLGAWLGEGALDAVDGEGWESPAGHQRLLLVLEDGGLGAEGLVQVVHCEGDVLVDLLLLLSDWSDELGDSRDLDVAVGVDEGGEDADQVRHWLLGGSAEHSGVEILTWAGDLDGVVVAAAETVGQAWLLGSEPVVVRNADGVCILEELVGLSTDEIIKTLRAILLHTLEAHQEIDWEFNTSFLVSLDGVQPSKNRSLIIGGSTTEHASLSIDSELEWLRVPSILLGSWLDIVVPVDEDGALLGVVSVAGDDNWWELEVLLVWLWAELAELDVGTQSLQLVVEPLAHANDIWAALVLSGDGWDGDGLAETINKVLGQGVDLGEIGVELRSHLEVFATLVLDALFVCEELRTVCSGALKLVLRN